MYSFTDNDLMVNIKEFCHCLFECADIEKSLTYCTDDIHYYNSLGSIDIVGKKKLYGYFTERQAQLKKLHQVVYHKYSVQRITPDFAIVHLLAELKGKFLVNTSVSVRKENNGIFICGIHGFISPVSAGNDESLHSGILKDFFRHLDKWKEDSKKIIVKYIINVTQDSVMTSYHSNSAERNIYDMLSVEDFIQQISHKFVSKEAKKTLQETYTLENLAEKFNSNEFNFILLFPYVNSEGKFMWIRSYNTLYQDPISYDLLCFTAVYDITEELLREKFSEFYFHSKIDFFIHLNMKRNYYSFYPCFVSREKTKLLNLSHDFKSSLNVFVENYVAEEDRQKILHEFDFATIIKKIRKNNFYSVFCRVNCEKGSTGIRYKQIHFFKFSKVPNIVNIVCTDATEEYVEEKRKNKVLTQALKATTNANKVKSNFLASMSHDLRTPMNAILGMTQLATEDLSNIEQVKESFSVIRQSSEHLLVLLNDILEMNRIENGFLKNESEIFSLVDEIKQAANIFSEEMEAKNLVFRSEFSSVVHSAVQGDKSKLVCIVGNILSNAVKYTPSGGEIFLTVKEEPGKTSNHISVYKISVRDTGVGIPKEKIPFIFESFCMEKPHGPEEGGFGLGLAAVKAFAENMGGTVSVESEAGKGSEFTVEIPYQLAGRENQAEIKKNITTKEINLTNFSVLLVEDNPVNILMFQKLLEKCGAKVTVAQNGQIAYETFLKMDKDMPFNLIFMDIQMPVMNGFEATKKIREIPTKRAKEIPIIAATANAFQEDIKNSLDAGMNGHIAKPIKLNELLQVLVDLKIL